jgi:hypothetical protein
MVPSLIGCQLRITKFLMGDGKISLEAYQRFVYGREVTPVTASFREHAGGENKSVCNVDNLFWAVGSYGSVSNVDCIFNLIEECFDGLVGVVAFLHGCVVGLKVSWAESTVIGVQK